jgi:acetylornithine/succinyldiaminopimelate/putrescine aminotransferase
MCVAFLPALRELCNKHGLLLIADEVQAGYGRTGKLFAVEHTNTTPDIMILAKGIASGYPLSAVVTYVAASKQCAVGDWWSVALTLVIVHCALVID